MRPSETRAAVHSTNGEENNIYGYMQKKNELPKMIKSRSKKCVNINSYYEMIN